MNNQILLSVCVPTYNRPVQFKRMLMGLMPQLTDETELVIRDDSPNDETRKVFDELVEKFKPLAKLNYIQGEKIGLDAANLFLLENAIGKYIWWFSDDDEFMPGAIAKTLELIKKYPEITFIWVNFCDFKIIAIDRGDGFFKDRNDVLESLTIGAIGLLSTYFLRREDALMALPVVKKFVKGFSFASTSVVFYVLTGSGKFYFLRGPYILCHVSTTVDEIKKSIVPGKKIDNKYFNIFGVDFYNIVMEFSDKFTIHAVRKILTNSFSCVWRGILVGWIGGWDTPQGKRWKMFKLYWSFPEFWIAMPLFLLPLWVNKILYKIYKIFFSHRKLVFWENLRLLLKNKK